MITTLIVLAVICALSLGFILVIPSFAATKAFMSFYPVISGKQQRITLIRLWADE